MAEGEHIDPRQLVQIPQEMHVQFRRLVIARKQVGSYLCYQFLLGAVVDAELGLWLPPAAQEPAVSGRRWAKVVWKQSSEEFAVWRTTLWDAGSSPTVAMRGRIADYIEADGDPVAAELTRRRRVTGPVS